MPASFDQMEPDREDAELGDQDMDLDGDEDWEQRLATLLDKKRRGAAARRVALGRRGTPRPLR
jgi:hypothetical protein